jgi:hypothetical protein
MGLVSPAQSADGETIEAADINSPINTIANEFNGNIEAVNLKASAVTTAKIADDAVTTAKLADDAVTAAKIDWASTGSGAGIWWEELGRTTLSSSASSISLTLSGSRSYLYLIAILPTTGGTVAPLLRFNGDSGTNYSVRATLNGAADVTAVSQTGLNLTIATSINPHRLEGFIYNSTSIGTTCEIRSTFAPAPIGATVAPDRRINVGVWASTSAITSLSISNTGGTGSFASGATLIVLGHN